MTGIFQPSFSGGIIGPGLGARPDVSKYQSGVQDAVNLTIRVHGGLQNRAGTLFLPQYAPGLAVKSPTHPITIPFDFAVDDTYTLVFSHLQMRVIREGAYIIDGSFTPTTVVGVTAETQAKLVMANAIQANTWAVGDWAFLDMPGHPLHSSIVSVVSVSADKVAFQIIGGYQIDTTNAALWPAFTSVGTASKIYVIDTPYAEEDLPALRYARDLNTMFIVHENYAPRKLVRVAEDNWQLSVINFVPTISSPTILSLSATPGTNPGPPDLHQYVVSAVAQDSGEESLPSAPASVMNDLSAVGARNILTWTAVPGAQRYVVYKHSNGVFGYIGGTSSTYFDDVNIAPDTDDTPQGGRNPFPTPDDWPREVFFYEQRLGFASTKNNPLLIEMSQSTQFTNFNRSLPVKDNEAISLRLRGERLNRIVGVRPTRELLVFTTGGEWTILGGDDQDMLTPSNPRAENISTHGSALNPGPIAVGEVTLFVSDGGSSVRDMAANRDIPSSEVSLLVKDLMENRRIKTWAYAQQPDKLIWTVFEDGSLWSLAYMLEHEIWGWTRHQLGGPEAEVLWVSVVREGRRDTPYFTVRRKIAGRYVTTIERLDPRLDVTAKSAYFVDCGVRFDVEAPSATRVGGLLHLRGETLTAVNAGNVIEQVTVDDAGFVDLGDPVDHPRVGYPYIAELTTLPIEIESRELGSMWGRMKTFSTVAVSFLQTRGASAAVVGVDTFDEFKEWQPEFETANIPLFTGLRRVTLNTDWQPDLRLRIRQAYPMPMTVLGIAPDWEFGA